MKFIRQDTLSESELSSLGMFDVVFHGVDDIDDRSRHSVLHIKKIGRKHHLVSYDPENFTLSIDQYVYRLDSLEDISRDFKATSIAIDATTMEFPEILLILHAYYMLRMKPRCGFLYVEPQRYARRDPEQNVAQGTAFNLSSGFRAKNAIPTYACMLSGNNKAHLVAFLGFEGARLSRILNDDDGHFFKQITIVFGVPPFQTSWDLHALMANHRLLQATNTHVRFCGANAPRAAYNLLKEAHIALPGSSTNRLAVAPFGTKPMALGAALYCVENDQLRAVYDHPVKAKGRSIGVQCTHWYEVDLGSQSNP